MLDSFSDVTLFSYLAQNLSSLIPFVKSFKMAQICCLTQKLQKTKLKPYHTCPINKSFLEKTIIDFISLVGSSSNAHRDQIKFSTNM